MKKTVAENKYGAKAGDILVEHSDTECESLYRFFQVIGLRGTTQIVIKKLRYSNIAFDECHVQIIPIPDSMEPEEEEIRRTEKYENEYCAKHGNNRAYLYDKRNTYFNSYYRHPFIDTKQWSYILNGFTFNIGEGTGFFSADGKTNISCDLPIEVRYPDSSIQILTIQALLNGDAILEGPKKPLQYYHEWIISMDISMNLVSRKNLTCENTMDWILSAPHKNIVDKLSAIQIINPCSEKGKQKKEKLLSAMRSLIKRTRSRNATFQYYYETEIREYGIRCPSQDKILFSDAGSAISHIVDQTKEISGIYESYSSKKNERYYGILYEYQIKSNKRFVNEWDFIVNPDGEIIYCLPAPHKKESLDKGIGMINSSYIRLPYPSGTIITMRENPFFGPLKGVLLNKIEPEEKGFVQKDNEQFLIYLAHIQTDHLQQVKYIQLEDDGFLSTHFGSDFPFPFRQFLERYDGKLSAQESQLEDISQLIIKDKQKFYMKNTEITKRGIRQ